MAKVFKEGSWWEKPLPANAPIHASSATWLTALTALDVSEGNHLNGSGQGHISLNIPDPGGQFDCPIFRVTGSDTSYPIWSMGSGSPTIPLRWAPTAQGGTGEGLRIPEYQKNNNWIKPSNNTHGPNSNDSPFQVIDTTRGYVGWLSDTYWNKDTLRWECWDGTPSGLSVTFGGGANIYYLASYGVDSGNFNEATSSKPSFWPTTLTGSGVDPTTYQDEPRNQGTGRGNNSYFRVVNYDDFIANGGLTHAPEVYLTATGDAGAFPMKGFETGRGGDIPEGTRMRVKATFTDSDITSKLTAAGLTGTRLSQATLFIKGFRDYGVYVGDNSGSNSRIKLEDKTQESSGGTNPWIVQTNDLQAFGWGDWEIIDSNYDPPPLSPGVAFDAGSESHTGTTGSVSQASFSWTHTPLGTPKGVLIYVMQDNSSTDKTTSVTYGGTAVPAVSGGLAAKTGSGQRLCKAFYLGLSVPTGAQTVVVNRTNDTTILYAAAITVTASTGTEVDTATIFLQQNNATLVEHSIDDGSPGTNSLRFAGLSSGLGSVPSAGANSTAVISIDFGANTAAVVRETVAGQGSRNVGFSSGTASNAAAVHLAVRELQSVTISPTPGGVTLAGQGITTSRKISVAPGAIALAGKTLGSTGATIYITDATSGSIWNSEEVTWSSASGNWNGVRFGNLFFTGQPITLSKSLAVTPGAVTLLGKSIAVTRSFVVTPGAVTLDGVDTVVAGATTYLITPPTITLAGASVSTVWTVTASPGAATLAGTSVAVSFVVLATTLDAGHITLAGRAIVITVPAAVKQPPHDIGPNPELHALHKLRKHYGLVRN